VRTISSTSVIACAGLSAASNVLYQLFDVEDAAHFRRSLCVVYAGNDHVIRGAKALMYAS
jgi:hypothetical protein